MSSQLADDKAGLRRRLLAARGQLSPAELAAAGRSLRDAVLDLPQTQMAGTVAAYYSVGTEPDTHGLLFALWKRGAYVLLPLLLPDGDLDWASYEGPDSLPARRARADGAGRAAAWRGRRVQRGPGAGARAGGGSFRAAAGPGRRFVRPRAGPGRCAGTDGCAAVRHGAGPGVPAEPHDQRVRMVARPSAGVTTLPLHG